MARIPESDRLAILDAHIAHWTQANTIAGTPIEIVPGYGVAQLQALRDQYNTLVEAIAQIEANDLPTLRAERDTIWGVSPQDNNGVWFKLTLYKNMVRARLGARHPLTRTVPNLGDTTVERFLDILHNFIDHWERLNPALPTPLTLGSFTLANLQTVHTNLHAKITAIAAALTLLALKREEREQLFGDEPEELREETSAVSRLLLYHATIEATFPNQPIADSLPEIFPVGPETPLPTFRINWLAQPGGIVKLWYDPPAPALSDAALVFLKEGATELTTPVISTTPGSVQVHNFSGVTVVGELDQLELRNGDGITIARGVRDTSLAEPA